MNTTLTIKTQKKLRDDVKKTAVRLGVPVTTVVNALLSQFVRDQEVTLSVHPQIKAKKLAEWKRTSADMDKGHYKLFTDVEDLVDHLGLEKPRR